MKTPTSGLTVLAAPRLDPGFDVCGCAFGHFPWDDWGRWALANGLDEQVAGRARLLIREWFNHGWDDCLRECCGWSDDGLELFQFALRSPGKALRQWDILMRTDGLRGDRAPGSGEWTWGYLRPDAEALLHQLTTQN